MTQKTGNDNRDTVNSGPASKKEKDSAFDMTGNALRKGEDPSPDDRERGETSAAEPAPATNEGRGG